jgi:hypothetical protein
MRQSRISWLVLVLVVGTLSGCGGSSAANAPPAETPVSEAPAPETVSPPTPDKTNASASEESKKAEAPKKAEPTKDGRAPAAVAADGSPAPAKPTVADDSRTTGSINAVIEKNRPALRKCYEEALKTDPGLRGNIVLLLSLDATGKVTSASIDNERSSIKTPKVGECLVKLAKGLVYPASSKGLDKDFEKNFGFGNSAM